MFPTSSPLTMATPTASEVAASAVVDSPFAIGIDSTTDITSPPQMMSPEKSLESFRQKMSTLKRLLSVRKATDESQRQQQSSWKKARLSKAPVENVVTAGARAELLIVQQQLEEAVHSLAKERALRDSLQASFDQLTQYLQTVTKEYQDCKELVIPKLRSEYEELQRQSAQQTDSFANTEKELRAQITTQQEQQLDALIAKDVVEVKLLSATQKIEELTLRIQQLQSAQEQRLQQFREDKTRWEQMHESAQSSIAQLKESNHCLVEQVRCVFLIMGMPVDAIEHLSSQLAFRFASHSEDRA
jgi:chromosome segregation ATPase